MTLLETVEQILVRELHRTGKELRRQRLKSGETHRFTECEYARLEDITNRFSQHRRREELIEVLDNRVRHIDLGVVDQLAQQFIASEMLHQSVYPQEDEQ